MPSVKFWLFLAECPGALLCVCSGLSFCLPVSRFRLDLNSVCLSHYLLWTVDYLLYTFSALTPFYFLSLYLSTLVYLLLCPLWASSFWTFSLSTLDFLSLCVLWNLSFLTSLVLFSRFLVSVSLHFSSF